MSEQIALCTDLCTDFISIRWIRNSEANFLFDLHKTNENPKTAPHKFIKPIKCYTNGIELNE